MNDPIMNSVINPSVRAGIEEMFLKAEADKRARYETAVTEHRLEEAARQASYSAAVRQTIEAFRSR